MGVYKSSKYYLQNNYSYSMLTNLHLNFKDHIYDACCRVGKAKTLLKAHSERNKIIFEEIVLKTVALST